MSTQHLAADTIRTLAMDGVQKANSGHPGMPMGMADLAVVLWGKHLLVDPTDPEWPDRDRFILSNGHGSMLIYSLLHLAGFPVSMDDLQNFRQLGSPTAGHPEREPHLGIEMTTGPLGQGFATGVGMAMAERHLRSVFGADLVDHMTYGFVSDGDLMEGISYESASLAGRLGLGKLVYLYDDNEISIGGETDITWTEDVAGRFTAAGWHVLDIDGHDHGAIDEAITAARVEADRPSIVAAHTHIGYGSPNKQDTASSHGSPLGDEEIALTKEALGWPGEEPFHVPAEVREWFASAMEAGATARAGWEGRRDAAFADTSVADLWAAHHEPDAITIGDLGFETGASVATRKASGAAINALAPQVPGLVGGSADLAPSNNTYIDGSPEMQDDPSGRNIRFGVREHAMGAAVNGMAIHGGLRPYGGTFLVFNDYMRASTRLAALMEAPSIFVYTHDSIFLGEDGPTHQPVEHVASLRAMPNMWVIRPADATETAEAWEMALRRTDGPTCIVLTRQGLPVMDRAETAGMGHRGGYVVRDGDGFTIVATGSEVSLAIATVELLGRGRVVSMPCVEAFDAQDDAYRAGVLGDDPIVTLEAGTTFGWHRFAGSDGLAIGIDTFGASAPAGVLADHFGFTPEKVAARITEWLG